MNRDDQIESMEGRARTVPGVQQRMETGPVQFGDDWPGLFIRGDNAGAFAMQLHTIIRKLELGYQLNWLDMSHLRQLQKKLGSCVIGPAAKSVEMSEADE